ncbi:HIT domain-containing protein [Pseudomarimonas arenosa]|uniref:HIT family protein n=1 Tax=Pseudomarimonas arenosa TaxID=2774145 RepID=A0AAW3ZPZ3_9GAMM|nr:HIT family protein [Pseudomarimonas arenosa]MBD8527005.1 HIT family protein [Pseudomarimonas arenosa]
MIKPSHHANGSQQPFSLHAQLASDSHPVAEFELSSLRLMDDCNYPWLVLVPRVSAAVELIDLDAGEQALLMGEINSVSRVLKQLFRPHKLNVAALGNVVPQLHVHVIARFTDDPAWPAPVWGRTHARPYEPEALVKRVRDLRQALEN